MLVIVALTASCGHANHSPKRDGRYLTGDLVRITLFYASPLSAHSYNHGGLSVSRGEKTLLCYGVENAVAVQIEPSVEAIRPALSRCIGVSLTRTTRFTLKAEDRDGRTAEAAVTVIVTAPAPHFIDLSISAREVAPGDVVAFCFKAMNAVRVAGAPGYFLHGGVPRGDCLVNQPEHTTSYTLTIQGADGQQDEATSTVNVR